MVLKQLDKRGKQLNLDFYLTPHTKINLVFMKCLHTTKTVMFLEGHVRKKLHALEVGKC